MKLALTHKITIYSYTGCHEIPLEAPNLKNYFTFQVSPTELENIILEIDGAADAAVVGIPDTLAGEVPRAYVVLKPGSKLTDEDVARYVNSKVTHYKKLVGGVRFIEAIPRNPSGKILRNQLKLAN